MTRGRASKSVRSQAEPGNEKNHVSIRFRKNYSMTIKRNSEPCCGISNTKSLLASLVRTQTAVYYGGRCSHRGVRPSVDRLRIVGAGRIMPVDDSPLTRASLLLQL